MTCPTCFHLGHCDPNLGRGQGKDCENSRQATLAALPRFIARMCNGGEQVENGKTATACSYCSNGICRGMEACDQGAST